MDNQNRDNQNFVEAQQNELHDSVLMAVDLFVDGAKPNAERYLRQKGITADVLSDENFVKQLREKLGGNRAEFFSMLHDVSEGVRSIRTAENAEIISRERAQVASAREVSAIRPEVRVDELGELRNPIQLVVTMFENAPNKKTFKDAFKKAVASEATLFVALGALQRPAVLEAIGRSDLVKDENFLEWIREAQSS